MDVRAPRSAAAALVTVLAASVLVGCASQAAQPMATLGGGPVATLAPQATAAPTAATTLGSDFAVDLDLTVAGTATQITILNQAKALILAYEKAVEADDPKDPAYQSLVVGRALSSLYQSVSTYKSSAQRPTGTDLFYDFTTDVSAGLGADVLFCEDRTQEHLVNSGTGAAVKDADTGEQHWDFGFDANSNGTWSIAFVSTQAVTAGSTQCT
ncbi:MAG TPA: hypothetical protein VGX23_13490 [Actinocrinis sp.]|nr:hypothetical protein [Actinocrinis sp.]